MTTNPDGRETDPVAESLGRLGDAAPEAPPWSALMKRHLQNLESHGRMGRHLWSRSPGGRIGFANLAAAGAVVITLIATGWLFMTLLPDDDTNVISVDETPSDTTTTTSTTAPPDENGLGTPVLGCVEETPLVDAITADLWGEADLDGDNLIDRVATVPGPQPETPGSTHVVVELGAGGWIVSDLDVSTGLAVPSFTPGWPLAVDLDLDGDDELLAKHQANNFSHVVIYDLQGCTLVPVAVDGDDGDVDTGDIEGFPTEASSASCQDTCNVGLVCLPNGNLLSFESSAVDTGNLRGDHQWSTVEWRLENGTLNPVSHASGELPWNRIDEIAPPNTVTCQPSATNATADRSDEAAGLADLLGTRIVAVTAEEHPRFVDQGYVVTDGEVGRYDQSDYRVMGATDDVLLTATPGKRWANGPFLDFDGNVISCPAVEGWDEFPSGDPIETAGRTRTMPVQSEDGGWAVEVEGDEYGDPLPNSELLDNDWWAVPLWRIDCTTGARQAVPPRWGSIFPEPTQSEDVEVFLDITRRGGRTFYFNGGEGILSVVTDDGLVLADRVDAQTWSVSAQGTVVVVADFEGNVIGIDTTTAEQRWRINLDDNFAGHALHFQLDDRLILSDEFLGTVAVVEVETGELLIEPFKPDNLHLVYAGLGSGP